MIEKYAETRLPTKYGDFQCAVYRDRNGKEHLAMVKGDVAGKPDIMCRVHSECLTSEVFGSTKCDCKAQLDMALQKIAEEGAGVVIYMRDEGRGIGLGNKIRAYNLQEQGADTVDANRMLGLPDDTRDYTLAAEMLTDLQIESVCLMTNNPLKVNGLTNGGIQVTERVEHYSNAPTHAAFYLETKRDRMGHFLPEGNLGGKNVHVFSQPKKPA